ncbi:hypothetical protein SLW73_14840 [Glutamicibacter protophormiae]|uniref:hypothetical protein n=1 Tax=Glutamicibacter protophormiae TaxID=37930 RepID=UPI002A8175D3|nr:hypothetical protein [Glutamicibacter protophormiae]WPR64146.1 hypothetical protein SLW72_14850 [Glutamicibacter protophormiae]WPR67640.1 hypothetical protein SLW73_14840 [Glutamicibacter protophormiae]
MHRILPAFAISAISLSLVACSSTEPQETTPLPSPSSAPPSSSADPALERNDRGNLTRKVGETFTFRTTSDEIAATVRLDDIKANPKCTGDYPEKPKDGTLVALTFTVTSEPELSELGDVAFDGGWWKYIAADGMTYNGELDTVAAYSCLSDKQRLPRVGPSEKAQGSVVLELPDTKGVLIYGIGDGVEFDLSDAIKE